MPSCRVYVTVQPKSRRQGVSLLDGKVLKVRVNAPPEDGKANAAVRQLLAKTLKVPKTRVLIVAGEFARKKIVALPLSLDEVAARLAPKGPRISPSE
ncbi:MAG: DUF167 family protein [Dehalococcoidia bacterium]